MYAKTLRADAASNITRILDAARRAFGDPDTTVALSHIAQEAGVAAATLYRHFPSRQRLAEAVYARLFRAEIDPLFARLAKSDAPREAMRQIAEEISDVIRRERGLMLALGTLGPATAELLEDRRELLEGLVQRGQKAGNIRADITADDIVLLLGVLASASALLEVKPDQRRRRTDLLLDALRP